MKHAASLWAMMPLAGRKLLESAVQTDQHRFQLEQAAYDRSLETATVSALATEALRDAEEV